jgi:hypothetical protein
MDAAVEQEIVALVRAAGQEPKGVLCPHILIPEESLNDSEDSPQGADLVQATVDFVNWAMSEASLLPGEFPAEAYCAYYADYYLAQVNNGGHSQWAGNGGFSPLVVKPVGWALEAMGASDYLAIYRDFLRLMEDKDAAAKIMEGGGFGERVPEEDALNERFYALSPDYSYPMLTMSANWLRELPCLKPLSPAALIEAREAVAEANPYRAERLRGAQGEQEKQILYWAPRKLCADANITLDRLTAGDMTMIEGKPRFAWYMQTDQGLMLMALFKGSIFASPKARLYRADAALRAVGKPVAEVAVSKADYAAAVPAMFA